MKASFQTRRWVFATVAAGALVSGVVWWNRPQATGVEALAAAAQFEQRSIESRLTGGFAWAPYMPRTRTTGDNGGVFFAGDVAAMLSKVRGNASPAARHVAGVASVLAGRTDRAVETLRAAVQSTRDPRIWSDLAAALQEASLDRGAPGLLAESLAACDRALAEDAGLPEALFNRAVVLERLGLRDDAREAWERYLSVDSGSEWAAEARQRLRSLAPATPFLQLLDRAYERLQRDPSEAEALARQDVQGARGFGAMEVLGRWAAATLRGDERDAERHLRVARSLGTAVARMNGDRLLERAVAAIDDAAAPARALLASAHSDYREGLQAFQAGRPAQAEPLLRRAAAAFESARSPMALSARYFAANTVFEQGRREDAQRQLEALLPIPPEFPACRAQVQWELGVCHTSAAEWGRAISLLEESAAALERLGEWQNASAVRRVAAFAFERVGDPASAWKHRMIALRGLGQRSSLHLAKAVASIADAAVLRRAWDTAASFLTLEIAVARRIGDDVQLVDALLMRSAVHAQMNVPSAAAADLAAADAASSRLSDRSYREHLQGRRLRVAAMLARSSAEAAALLTRAIAFESGRGEPMELPSLFLQRARAFRQSGDLAAASADLQRGMAELELHRESLPAGEARWGAFHAAGELFQDAIDLAVEQHDAAGAFAASERARARTLLDSYGSSPAVRLAAVPRGTVIVEYAALPSRLVIFAASPGRMRMATVAYTPAQIASESAAFTGALRCGDDGAGRRAATAMYRRLVEPVAAELLGASTIVFVPDPATAGIPFSALADARGFLLERHAIVVAPSAAVYTAIAARPRQPSPRSALVVSSSGTEGARLAFAEQEAASVGRLYPAAVQLHDDEARLDQVERRAEAADAIHFAGHGVGDEAGLEPASLVLSEHGQPRRVDVRTIAKLPLKHGPVVVLAGCNTARGARRAAEGVVSVAHGFLAAGASSVVATLWPIDDAAAAIFFPRLHERLAAGMPAAEALRAAQLECIRRGDVPASLWAAVRDIGS